MRVVRILFLACIFVGIRRDKPNRWVIDALFVFVVILLYVLFGRIDGLLP